jgi:hypothetical protein
VAFDLSAAVACPFEHEATLARAPASKNGRMSSIRQPDYTNADWLVSPRLAKIPHHLNRDLHISQNKLLPRSFAALFISLNIPDLSLGE